jgi:hypothetical protein
MLSSNRSLNSTVDRYLSPKEGMITTIILSLFSGLLPTTNAALIAAPADIPTRTPCTEGKGEGEGEERKGEVGRRRGVEKRKGNGRRREEGEERGNGEESRGEERGGREEEWKREAMWGKGGGWRRRGKEGR